MGDLTGFKYDPIAGLSIFFGIYLCACSVPIEYPAVVAALLFCLLGLSCSLCTIGHLLHATRTSKATRVVRLGLLVVRVGFVLASAIMMVDIVAILFKSSVPFTFALIPLASELFLVYGAIQLVVGVGLIPLGYHYKAVVGPPQWRAIGIGSVMLLITASLMVMWLTGISINGFMISLGSLLRFGHIPLVAAVAAFALAYWREKPRKEVASK